MAIVEPAEVEDDQLPSPFIDSFFVGTVPA